MALPPCRPHDWQAAPDLFSHSVSAPHRLQRLPRETCAWQAVHARMSRVRGAFFRSGARHMGQCLPPLRSFDSEWPRFCGRCRGGSSAGSESCNVRPFTLEDPQPQASDPDWAAEHQVQRRRAAPLPAHTQSFRPGVHCSAWFGGRGTPRYTTASQWVEAGVVLIGALAVEVPVGEIVQPLVCPIVIARIVRSRKIRV